MNDWEKRFQEIIDEVHANSQKEQQEAKKENTASEKENTSYQGQGFTYSYGDAYQQDKPDPNKKAPGKEPVYITKRFFVIMLCVVMVASAVIGAACYGLAISTFGGTSIDKSINTTNYNLVRATGSELTIQEIVALNENAVVAITTEQLVTSNFWFGSSYVAEGAGSGVIYSSDGYIITNNHVIEDARSIMVTLHNGKEYQATLVATDPVTDVAVVKIDEVNLSTIKYGNSDKITVGDLAVAIGNPLGTLSGTPTEGIISALEREITIDDKKMKLIQTSASINPGNSGGGLFNDKGELIGLVVAKSGGTNIEGLGFAIPVNRVAKVVESLIVNGFVAGRPQAGIKILDLTSAMDAMQYGVSMTGVYIGEVTGNNAKKSGLAVGDLIYMLDGVQITSSAHLISLIQEHEIGDKVTFTIVRNNKMQTIDLVLEEASRQ